MATRCRLCTSNDRDALIEEMAAEAWNAGGYGRDWSETLPQWHEAFRRHVAAILDALQADHGHAP